MPGLTASPAKQASTPRPSMEEQAEAVPDRRLNFSRAVSLVSICTLSYTFWIIYLCGHPDSAARHEFYDQVPDTVYMWPMAAFATAVLLNLQAMAFERRPVKRQLCFLAVYISGVAFVYEFLAWKQAAPIYVTAAGRPISLLRYVMWGHATPVMIYALSMISDFTSTQVWQTMAVDVVMIATVIPGELIPAWHRWIWNAVSCGVYPYIFHQLWHMYSAGIAEARHDGSHASLRMLRNLTVTFWSVFPAIWVLVQLEWVDVYAEEVLWCAADTLGKIFFSSTLLHSNFMSIEHRRLVAMRVVEEANRTRVIHELRALLAQKEGFIAMVSHELRTPLNGIIGLSSALLMDGDDSLPPDTVKTLTTIRNSGARLLTLINDILDAAALRKGKLAVAQGKVNLRYVADDVIDLAQALAKPGVAISNKIPHDTPLVVGDTSRLVQVLYNLLGNAAKFTERGDIWVEAHEVAGQAGMVAVSVHDTGIGIPEDKLEDIFHPFAQVDMSATRRYGGTGLGLNLVQQLVEAHGGAVTVASRRGKGSVFTFTLRAWDSDDGSPPPPLTEATRKSLHLAAWAAARDAAADLDQADGQDADQQPLLGSPDRLNQRRDSETDMMQRLSYDAQPANMLQRLSTDSRMRSSYDAEYTDYHKAPQQLAPQAAFNAFLSAGPHSVVKRIQQGEVEVPAGVAAAATARDASVPPMALHDWILADKAVEEEALAGQIRVLSVDDDPVNQMVIQNMLTKAGFIVLQAPDGEKALDMLEDSLRHGSPPHVMLLDVMMPGLSGYDVARLVRRRHPDLMLPVIMVSANSREEHVVEGLQAGGNDYVCKPFRQKELVARIQAQLRTRQFSRGVAPTLADGSAGATGAADSSRTLPDTGTQGAATVDAPKLDANGCSSDSAARSSADLGAQMAVLQRQLLETQRQLAALAATAGDATTPAFATADPSDGRLPVTVNGTGRSSGSSDSSSIAGSSRDS